MDASSPQGPEAAAPREIDSTVRNQYEDKLLLVLTLIIGAVVGLVVVAFILVTENLGSRIYPEGGAAWRRVLAPVLGALISGALLYRYFPEARGSGIPQTKAALFLRDGYIAFRTVAGKFSLCSLSLASGIALGREGPSVHVGAGIASVLGRRLGLSPSGVRSLLPSGAAAAVAAAFNTPVSGVLFALEEVMGDLHAPVIGSVVLSSATSWIVLHLVLGDEPLFHVPAYQLVHPVEFVVYAALGVAGGLVSTAFVKLLLWQRKRFLRAPASAQWYLPAIGGLTVGLLGWFFPEVLGVGYAYVGRALNGQMLIGGMALLVVLKVVATATCYSSGNAGGIFGPSLFIGAMMGGAVGGAAHTMMPDYTGSVGAYALVGMGAAFAGIVRVPLTSVIMVFEITRDYAIIVPLMIANLISYFIASRLQETPIYHALQLQDGVHLPSGAGARSGVLTVADGCRAGTPALHVGERIQEALRKLSPAREAWPVVDANGFRGMVTAGQLREAADRGMSDEPLASLAPDPGASRDLGQNAFPHVYPDDHLETAMRLLAGGRLKALPVVSRANMRQLLGTITLPDVLETYARGERAAPVASQPARLPRALLPGVIAALAGLGLLAGSLNYYYRAERAGRAEQHFKAGGELLRQGRLAEAIERYRNALSISHDPRDRLALALALVEAQRFNEASVYLGEILRGEPSSGPANFAMAKVFAAQGNVPDAVLSYQRAISGVWRQEPVRSRAAVQIEFADYLRKANRREQARAQLLALLDDMPADASLRMRVGRMLIELGQPSEAAQLFSRLLKEGAPTAAAYAALGDARFALRQYSRASQAYHDALQLDPANMDAARRAGLAGRIVALDPSQAGLRAAERYRRSQETLRAAMEAYARCVGENETMGEPLKAEAAEARAALAFKRRPASFSDAAEERLLLARRLWSESVKLCGAHPGDDALEFVLGTDR